MNDEEQKLRISQFRQKLLSQYLEIMFLQLRISQLESENKQFFKDIIVIMSFLLIITITIIFILFQL